MHAGKRSVLVALPLAVLLVSAGGVATAALLDSDVADTPEPSISVGPNGEVDYCPTREELNAYWEANGRELKPTVNCEYDPPELPDPNATREPEPLGHPVPGPSTVAEAQEQCDPENDPWTLIAEQNGEFSCLMGTGLGEPPPAWVITTDDFHEWLTSQQESQP